jgi:hypothetical protein
MSKHKHRTKHRDQYAWGDDPEVEDGRSVSVPLMMCDAPRKWPGWVSPLTDAEVALLDRHKSGFRTATHVGDDHQRVAGLEIARDDVRDARAVWLKRMSDAWRMDGKRKPPDDEPDEDDEDDEDESRDSRSLADVRRPAIAARDAWVRSLSGQWRALATAPRLVTDVPTLGARPFARDVAAAGPGPAATLSPGGVPDDPQKRRDQAWHEYSNTISQAWKNAGPGPSIAGAGPQWKGPAT